MITVGSTEPASAARDTSSVPAYVPSPVCRTSVMPCVSTALPAGSTLSKSKPSARLPLIRVWSRCWYLPRLSFCTPGMLLADLPPSSTFTQLSGLKWIRSSFIIRSEDGSPIVTRISALWLGSCT